jgi:hypothetical protein
VLTDLSEEIRFKLIASWTTRDPRYGLTHNPGGFPFQNICSIAIIGKYK